MGRELKRVSLDFDWPINKTWYGYLLSHCLEDKYGMTCDDCKLYAKNKGIEIDICPNYNIDNEPPVGEGFQMWETTSEGSPISPVFKTAEELATWLTDTKASPFGHQVATYDQWMNMIKAEWCLSMVMTNGELKNGVEFCSDKV